MQRRCRGQKLIGLCLLVELCRGGCGAAAAAAATQREPPEARAPVRAGCCRQRSRDGPARAPAARPAATVAAARRPRAVNALYIWTQVKLTCVHMYRAVAVFSRNSSYIHPNLKND
jgi:hypothetical protein